MRSCMRQIQFFFPYPRSVQIFLSTILTNFSAVAVGNIQNLRELLSHAMALEEQRKNAVIEYGERVIIKTKYKRAAAAAAASATTSTTTTTGNEENKATNVVTAPLSPSSLPSSDKDQDGDIHNININNADQKDNSGDDDEDQEDDGFVVCTLGEKDECIASLPPGAKAYTLRIFFTGLYGLVFRFENTEKTKNAENGDRLMSNTFANLTKFFFDTTAYLNLALTCREDRKYFLTSGTNLATKLDQCATRYNIGNYRSSAHYVKSTLSSASASSSSSSPASSSSSSSSPSPLPATATSATAATDPHSVVAVAADLD